MNFDLLVGVFILALIVTVAGAVVTIVQPHTLSFSSYVQDLVELAAALGLTAAIGAAATSYRGHHDE